MYIVTGMVLTDPKKYAILKPLWQCWLRWARLRGELLLQPGHEVHEAALPCVADVPLRVAHVLGWNQAQQAVQRGGRSHVISLRSICGNIVLDPAHMHVDGPLGSVSQHRGDHLRKLLRRVPTCFFAMAVLMQAAPIGSKLRPCLAKQCHQALLALSSALQPGPPGRRERCLAGRQDGGAPHWV